MGALHPTYTCILCVPCRKLLIPLLLQFLLLQYMYLVPYWQSLCCAFSRTCLLEQNWNGQKMPVPALHLQTALSCWCSLNAGWTVVLQWMPIELNDLNLTLFYALVFENVSCYHLWPYHKFLGLFQTVLFVLDISCSWCPLSNIYTQDWVWWMGIFWVSY